MLGVTGLVEERVPVVRPALGWITSITRSGTSIGAQKARGLFVGRSSTSRWTLRCAPRSIPRPASVAAQRGEHPVGGEGLVPARSRGTTGDVPALGLVQADADARAKTPVHRLLVQPLGRVEEGPALGGEASSS